MNLFCLGINHRTAPIDIREKVWFSEEEIQRIIPKLKEQYFKECFFISTCNRTELYFIPKEPPIDFIQLWKILVAIKNVENSISENHFYYLSSLNAVKHLFYVASGIDSMILGDIQILHQIKEAYFLAHNNNCTGLLLNKLLTTASRVGKRTKHETEISEGAVSVSYAAVELASKIFEDFTKRSALLIGAGETSELTAKHLVGRNLKRLFITNRTLQRAEALAAQIGGNAIDFHNLHPTLYEVDIVISSIESPSHILTANDFYKIMKIRGNKPLFIIDIGVPRNIDPKANKLENIFLHDIDGLNNIIDSNLAHRKSEIPKVQNIVLDELIQFNDWFQSLQFTPTIQKLREQFEAIRNTEVDKYKHQFNPEQQEKIEILTKRIVNKILHTPMINLKDGTEIDDEDTARNKISIIRHLFGLDRKTDA